MNESIRIIRDVLFRTFLIGVAFGLFYVCIYFGWRDYWDNLVVVRWALVDQKSLDILTLSFLGLIRFYLVFILLAPALALHWTLKQRER
jgi:hypothetical protein